MCISGVWFRVGSLFCSFDLTLFIFVSCRLIRSFTIHWPFPLHFPHPSTFLLRSLRLSRLAATVHLTGSTNWQSCEPRSTQCRGSWRACSPPWATTPPHLQSDWLASRTSCWCSRGARSRGPMGEALLGTKRKCPPPVASTSVSDCACLKIFELTFRGRYPTVRIQKWGLRLQAPKIRCLCSWKWARKNRGISLDHSPPYT